MAGVQIFERKPREEQHQLDLSSKLRQRSVVERIRHTDWEKGSDGPMVVEFDPTTACNLACPDCISRDLLNQQYFPRDRIQQLTAEMVDAGVRAVVLIGGGEPLAHPEIGWVIDYLAKHKVQLGLTTNGLLINRYLDRIAQHMSWTRVSMDAGRSETFGRIRPNLRGQSEFDDAIANMRELARIKRGRLGYSFMLYTEEGKFDPDGADKDKLIQSDRIYSNIPEIYEAAQLARDIGCDYFEIKPMYDIRHYAIIQNRELMEQAREQIRLAESLSTESFRVLRATKLNAVLDGESNLEPKSYTRCAVAQMRTLVTPSGTYVCPYFRGRPDRNIGSVMNQSFHSMWHGEARRQVMSALDPSRDCRMHCIRHESNLFIEDLLAQGNEVATVDDFDFFI